MSSALQARDPYAILHGWLAGAYIRPAGQEVPGRVGRKGWTSRLDGTRGPRCKTRDEAKVNPAARWLRVVTAAPRRL